MKEPIFWVAENHTHIFLLLFAVSRFCGSNELAIFFFSLRASSLKEVDGAALHKNVLTATCTCLSVLMLNRLIGAAQVVKSAWPRR